MSIKNNENSEIWKDVVGFEGLYQISNKGRVRSLDKVVHSSEGKTRYYTFINNEWKCANSDCAICIKIICKGLKEEIVIGINTKDCACIELKSAYFI